MKYITLLALLASTFFIQDLNAQNNLGTTTSPPIVTDLNSEWEIHTMYGETVVRGETAPTALFNALFETHLRINEIKEGIDNDPDQVWVSGFVTDSWISKWEFSQYYEYTITWQITWKVRKPLPTGDPTLRDLYEIIFDL